MTHSSGRKVRPPILLVCASATNAVAVVVAHGFDSGARATLVRTIAVVLGMLVAIVYLGIFRWSMNSRQSDGQFVDWRVSSSGIVTWSTAIAWSAGLLHLFLICYGITRNIS